MWFKEAEKYGALPLTDVFIEGFISVPADALRAKNHYTYYRGMDRLTDSAAAVTVNRSHEIKIPIERANIMIMGSFSTRRYLKVAIPSISKIIK